MSRWLLLPFLLGLTACGSKPPYEGKSVAELERMLRQSDPTVQTEAAIGLGKLGPAARPALPALIEALQSPEPLVRQSVAAALGQMGPDARDAVPALTVALRDSAWAVRRQAALTLAKIGPDARLAIPALEKLTADPEPLVRQAAQEALAVLQRGPSGKQAAAGPLCGVGHVRPLSGGILLSGGRQPPEGGVSPLRGASAP